MNILVLHLSDMHFVREKNFSIDNINAIAKALQQSMMDIKNIIVIISGDLAYSGHKSEYIEVDNFLHDLNTAITKRYGTSDIHFAIVPGNHDVDYNKGNLNRSDLEALETDISYSAAIRKELNKQIAFFEFSKSYGCFITPTLLYQMFIKYGDKIVQLNLINTAAFSSLDEDQGFHFLTEADIRELSTQHNSDFIISVMHHPHHWFSAHCKKTFEECLYSRSDIIFVGHEHYESSMKIEHEDASVNIFAAGKLSNRGDWTDSEFHVSILNINSRTYITRKYHWNKVAKIYEEVDKREITLSRDRYNLLGLIVRPEFSRVLEEDKYLISHSIRDYFVFPLLIEEYLDAYKENLPREINSMDTFMNILGSKKKIVISGASDSGKSVLARSIYAELASKKVTLF